MRTPRTVALLGMIAFAACVGEPAEDVETPAMLGPADGLELAAVDTGRVSVGDRAPDFTLATFDGGTLTLSEYRGAREVILVFYRGSW